MSDDYPRAPTQAEWEAMSPQERERVVASLPGEVTEEELSPPEGDLHFQAKVGALEALRNHFSRQRRRSVYLAAELPIYYPGEPRFAPDLLAVLEAEPHLRDKWVVSAEGKGLDFILEVHVGGDRKKDAERNVERYGRLGVGEYFVFDRKREQLMGWRLPSGSARRYVPIVPQQGRYRSERLGLELSAEEGKLRFYAGDKLLLESEELLEQLRQQSRQWRERALREARQRKQAEKKLDAEARRRKQAEQRAAKLEAELARLKSRRS